MAEAARKREKTLATYEDLLQVPEHLVAEVIDGELYTQPRPAVRHALGASALGSGIFLPFHQGKDGPGGWVVLFEPELHLGDKPHILVPDLAGWRRERMPLIPDVAWIELTPDWVCEVISPSTVRKDRVLKMPIYLDVGVEWLWILDPERKTLEAYQAAGSHWMLLGSWGGDDVVRVQPFDAVELPLAALWMD